MTAPHPLQTRTAHPLTVAGGEVTGTRPKGTNLYLAKITTPLSKGRTQTQTVAFKGQVPPTGLLPEIIEHGTTVSIRRADVAAILKPCVALRF